MTLASVMSRFGNQADKSFAEAVVGATGGAPFAAFSFQTIDVDGHRDPGPAEDGDEWGVGGVAEQHRVVARESGVQGGEAGVGDSFEVLCPDRGKNDQPHSAVARQRRVDETPPAVDRDLVAAIGEPPAELFGQGLEPTVVRRHPAGTEDRNLQFASIINSTT